MTISKEQFDKRLKEFMDLVQTALTNYYSTKFKNCPIPELINAGGRKYIKLTTRALSVSCPDHETVWAFIEYETGNIFKPATFKAPAKHARGNIYDENMLDNMGIYGPQYMIGSNNTINGDSLINWVNR